MRKSMILAQAVLIAAAGLTAASSPATADAGGTYYNCPVGYFCLYSDTNLKNKIGQHAGDWNGDNTYSGTQAVFNNGTMGGYDHVIMSYRYYSGGQIHYEQDCVHVAEPGKAYLGVHKYYFTYNSVNPFAIVWAKGSTSPCNG